MTTLLTQSNSQGQSGFVADGFGSNGSFLGMSGDVPLVAVDRNFDAAARVDAACGSGSFAYGDLTAKATKVLSERLPIMTAEKYFPINRSAGWAEKYQLMTSSSTGVAKKVCCTDDFPRVNASTCTFETGFIEIGTSYTVCRADLEKQAYSRSAYNKEEQLIKAAYLALARKANELAYFGDLGSGVLGIANNPYVPMQIAPYKLDSSVGNPQAILEVLTTAASQGYVTTGGTAMMPDTIVGPPSLIDYLKRRPGATANGGTCCPTSVMQLFMQYSSHIKYVEAAPELETAGPNGERCLFFYRKDPESIEWHYPLPFMMLPREERSYDYTVSMIARVGSVWLNYPEDCLLLVGI